MPIKKSGFLSKYGNSTHIQQSLNKGDDDLHHEYNDSDRPYNRFTDPHHPERIRSEIFRGALSNPCVTTAQLRHISNNATMVCDADTATRMWMERK